MELELKVSLFVLSVVVGCESLVCYLVYSKIEEFKNSFCTKGNSGTTRDKIEEELNTLKLSVQNNTERQYSKNIKEKSEYNRVYTSILLNTTEYASKNKGSANEFDVLRDIALREIKSLEDELQTEIPKPLFIGLMGTFIGITISLIIFYRNSDDIENFNIAQMLGGVAIAMVGSFLGLLLTYFQQSFFAKSKQKVETDLNIYLTGIRAILLPVLNQDAQTSFKELHQNLNKFNSDFRLLLDKFGEHINRFGTEVSNTMREARLAGETQLKLIQEFRGGNIAQIMSNTANVLNRLDSTLGRMDVFNSKLIELTEFTKKAGETAKKYAEFFANDTRFGEEMTKFNNLYIGKQAQASLKLLETLTSHRNKLDQALTSVHRSLDDFDDNIRNYFTKRKQQTDDLLRHAEQDYQTIIQVIEHKLERRDLVPEITQEINNVRQTTEAQLTLQSQEINNTLATQLNTQSQRINNTLESIQKLIENQLKLQDGRLEKILDIINKIIEKQSQLEKQSKSKQRNAEKKQALQTNLTNSNLETNPIPQEEKVVELTNVNQEPQEQGEIIQPAKSRAKLQKIRKSARIQNTNRRDKLLIILNIMFVISVIIISTLIKLNKLYLSNGVFALIISIFATIIALLILEALKPGISKRNSTQWNLSLVLILLAAIFTMGLSLKGF